MKRTFRSLIGFTAVALGILMLMGIMSRARFGHMARGANHHAAFESRFKSGVNSAENSLHSDVFTDRHTQNPAAQQSHYRHGRSGFGLLGVLLHLAVLGLVLKLVLSKIRKKRHGHGPIRTEANNDDLVNDIRVGDEIGRDSTPVSSDDLTVDDLLHAMKRLGIKKLEL